MDIKDNTIFGFLLRQVNTNLVILGDNLLQHSPHHVSLLNHTLKKMKTSWVCSATLEFDYNLSPEINLGPEKIWVPKKLGPKKIWIPKKIWVPKKNWVPKKI